MTMHRMAIKTNTGTNGTIPLQQILFREVPEALAGIASSIWIFAVSPFSSSFLSSPSLQLDGAIGTSSSRLVASKDGEIERKESWNSRLFGASGNQKWKISFAIKDFSIYSCLPSNIKCKSCLGRTPLLQRSCMWNQLKQLVFWLIVQDFQHQE